MWKTINQITKIKNKQNTTPQSINYNGKQVTNPLDMANCFNNYFSNVGPRLANRVLLSTKTYRDYLDPALSPPNSFFINATTESEILSLITKLDTSKANGPYDIPIYLIKLAKENISKPITTIFNNSFATGIFPQYLKLSRIIPLYKGDSSYMVSNYRPISLLSPFSKILEKLACSRLLDYFNKKDLFYKYQFGFRKNYSTTLALIEITDNFLKSIDNGLYTCGIFLDFSKAFDTVNHEILLGKLKHYGIRGLAYRWFENYLFNRRQFVSIGNVSSEYTDLICGIPQGSTLGPILFLIYINDIHTCSKLLSIRLFADDTNVFYSDKNLNNLEQIINEELIKLTDWLRANKLSLNISKSKYMLISSSNKLKVNLDIKIGNISLKQSEFVKYLGIYIDHNLTWKAHINYISKKISKSIGIISKLRHYVDLPTIKQVYYSLVYPYLQYGISVWGNTYKTRLSHLNKLNNKAIRIMTFSHFQAHAPPLFRDLHILQLSDINYLYLALFMHNYVNKNLPEAFNDYATPASDMHNYNTRHASKNLFVLPSSTNYGKFSVKLRGITIWNGLPNDIRKYSYSKFKKYIKHNCFLTYT